MLKAKALWVNGLIFAVAMATQPPLYCRCHVADYSFTSSSIRRIKPTVGWEVYWWDSVLYNQIATLGYEYANDGKGHNVAFFPYFP